MIVPRWEWRTFEAPLDQAARRLLAVPVDREERSDERYLLSLASDASIKVRDRRVDVKRRLAVAGNGLEQWMPILKADWPLDGETARQVLAAASTPADAVTRDAYTPREFLDELVAPNPSLLALAVSKHRVHYTFDGCMAELSELRAGGRVARTLAVESEDPERVHAAVEALGMADGRAECVARGLKALVGFGRRCAVIDVGTNSVKFHLAEQAGDGSWRPLVDRAEVTRLGEDLDRAGRLAATAIARTADAVAGMAEQAREHDARQIAVVGTAALRIAPNAAEFAEAVRARCGLAVEVVSAVDEARLAFDAARAGLGVHGRLVVFDTGGGSSQFSFGEDGRVAERFSLDVGAVRVTERFALQRPISTGTLETVLTTLAGELEALAGRPAPETVIGMGGAVTNLVAVKQRMADYDPERVHGSTLELAEIDRQIALYRELEAPERRAIVGLQANRADVILAGACIVRTVLALLGRDALLVSDRGLRHGVLAERFAVT